MRLTHGVSHVPNFLARSTHSGLKHDRGGAMLVLDDAAHLPTAFSAGLPGGIQLLQLPDPRNVREAMAAPDADGWKDAMDRAMYELVPRTSGMRTPTLGWVIHRKLRNDVFEKNNGRVVARGNHQRPGIVRPSPPSPPPPLSPPTFFPATSRLCFRHTARERPPAFDIDPMLIPHPSSL